MREPIADLDAAVAVLAKTDLGREEGIPYGVLVDRNHAYFLEFVSIQHMVKRGVGNRLAGVLVQRRLGIETFQMTHSTPQEQPNHTPGTRRHFR